MNHTHDYEEENREWLASLDYIIQNEDPERVKELLHLLHTRA